MRIYRTCLIFENIDLLNSYIVRFRYFIYFRIGVKDIQEIYYEQRN